MSFMVHMNSMQVRYFLETYIFFGCACALQYYLYRFNKEYRGTVVDAELALSELAKQHLGYMPETINEVTEARATNLEFNKEAENTFKGLMDATATFVMTIKGVY